MNRRLPAAMAKLDGKLAQFSMPEDLHPLPRPRAARAAHARVVAAPVFTSVPPLRGELAPAEYAEALAAQERSLRELLHERIG